MTATPEISLEADAAECELTAIAIDTPTLGDRSYLVHDGEVASAKEHYENHPPSPQKEHSMCRATRCKTCGRTTWAGCGQHISQVRAGVPAKDWCSGQHSADEKAAAGTGGGFLSRLFGR